MSIRLRAPAAMLPLLASACQYQSYQSDFGSGGVENHQFLVLFAIFLAICTVMYLLVIAFLFTAIGRSWRSGAANVVEEGRHKEEHPGLRSGLIGWGALVATGLVILAVARPWSA